MQDAHDSLGVDLPLRVDLQKSYNLSQIINIIRKDFMLAEIRRGSKPL